MTGCIFCRIARHEARASILYEDELIVAFRDRAPKAPVHLLVVPRKHICNLGDLQPQDQGLIAHIMMKLPQIARLSGLENGFRTVTNTGPGGRQEVYHLHFHILGGGTLPAI
ncbi:histidine triad nucleotide-binding protein [Marinobacterium sedimentorum]|uniref:histidine triad nucleotide-binding protein n=1 Tax=Marinobacterium sedimentorum TaxID=2927804 RepID=UPI0020C72F06|nr:histidine triad nucleotide-binding protein [Marinobacterium sedimentorum]MCP8690497.1 histidine triad nucleotide-binding protein [Marinobacterium sedimentorum]